MSSFLALEMALSTVRGGQLVACRFIALSTRFMALIWSLES